MNVAAFEIRKSREAPGPSSVADTIMSWMDLDCAAKLLVCEQLEILWANRLAREWLRNGETILEVDGHLVVGQSGARLAKLLCGAANHPQGTSVTPTGQYGHIIIYAQLVGTNAGKRTFGLTIKRTDLVNSELALGLSEAYRLTASEAKVLQLLYGGANAQLAAQSLGLSIDTIRTHIRNIYQKLGVNTREALLTQVRPFMVQL